MKDLPSTKTLLTIAVIALATAGLVACGNTDADKLPASATAGQPAVSDDDGEAEPADSGLPADVPFYLGKRNDNAPSLAPGYWRWNSEDATSSHDQIVENVKQAAKDQGWEISHDEAQSENTYLMILAKNGNEVVVTIQPEGDIHRVSYEYLSEAFIEASTKKK